MKRSVMFCHERIDCDGKTYLTHFNPNPKTTRRYGSGQICKVRVLEDVNGDYWAWWDTGWDGERKEFRYVYTVKSVVEMCFPYGTKAEEDRGRGKLMRVSIKMIEKVE